MKRTFWVATLVLAGGTVVLGAGMVGWTLHRAFGEEEALTPALARTEAETRVLATLREMDRTRQKRFGVPESDGRRLRLLTEAVNANHVVEVGTSTGYSTLWLALAVQSTGGHVTTFEIDAERAAVAQQNFRKGGVERQVTVVVGDAHKTLAGLKDPIDMVFLDADKPGYVDYLNQLRPLVRRGGLILAHNVDQAPDYVRRVGANSELETVLLSEGSSLSVSLKKR